MIYTALDSPPPGREEDAAVPAAGCVARRSPLPASVVAAAQAISDADRAVHVLALRFEPRSLRRAAAHGDLLKALGHDLLFAANPDTADPTKWDPSYRLWDPRTQTLIVSPLEKGAALATFSRIERTHRRVRESAARTGQVRALVDALLEGSPSLLLEAHWDNKDDTAFDGLIALDLESGLVRVLMSNDFA